MNNKHPVRKMNIYGRIHIHMTCAYINTQKNKFPFENICRNQMKGKQ